MGTLINNIQNSGPMIYYGDRFRQMVEDHLTYIQQMSTTSVRVIAQDEMAVLNRYVGDFYGFLDAIGYERRYFWTILRINGFRCRFDLDLTLTQFLLPDWSFIDKLAQLSKEKRK